MMSLGGRSVKRDDLIRDRLAGPAARPGGAATRGYSGGGGTGAVVPGTVAYDAVTNSATFHPESPLAADTAYRLEVGGVRDQAGATHPGRFTTTFRTAP